MNVIVTCWFFLVFDLDKRTRLVPTVGIASVGTGTDDV
jgi:hypothetical protein